MIKRLPVNIEIKLGYIKVCLDVKVEYTYVNDNEHKLLIGTKEYAFDSYASLADFVDNELKRVYSYNHITVPKVNDGGSKDTEKNN